MGEEIQSLVNVQEVTYSTWRAHWVILLREKKFRLTREPLDLAMADGMFYMGDMNLCSSNVIQSLFANKKKSRMFGRVKCFPSLYVPTPWDCYFNRGKFTSLLLVSFVFCDFQQVLYTTENS